MLIEFSLENCKSFASMQSLSLVASTLKDHRDGRILKVPKPHDIDVLNSAIILGKNGSGKSTLVDAMEFVTKFVRFSSSSAQAGDEITFRPNRLDTSLSGKDTSIRIIFSVQEKLYQFYFSFNNQRVTEEELSLADKNSRFRKIYRRLFSKKTERYTYTFSLDFKGEKALWRTSTRDNALFLSTAVQLNANNLRPPFDWLTQYFRPIDASSGSFTNFTANLCRDKKQKRRIMSFLKKLDILVDDIIVEEDNSLEDFLNGPLKNAFREDFIEKTLKRSDRQLWSVKFVHTNSDGNHVDFDIDDESSGTKALFGLAGPIFDSLTNGYCLVIDEINTSLHPLILRALIDAFSNPKINVKRAQIIFTSHDTSLLSNYFRRDQVWFMEKTKFGQSKLVPLSDYSPRKGEALEKGYLGGRYGGIPAISPVFEAIED